MAICGWPGCSAAPIRGKDEPMQPSDFKSGEAVLLTTNGPIEVAVTRVEGQYVFVEYAATPDMLTKLAEGMTLDGGSGLG